MSLAETQTGLVGVMTHPIGNPDCLTVDFFYIGPRIGQQVLLFEAERGRV